MSNPLFRQILLEFGEEISIECCIHHFLEPADLGSVLSEGKKDGIFVGPLLAWQRRVGQRGRINRSCAPGSIMNNFLDLQLFRAYAMPLIVFDNGPRGEIRKLKDFNIANLPVCQVLRKFWKDGFGLSSRVERCSQRQRQDSLHEIF